MLFCVHRRCKVHVHRRCKVHVQNGCLRCSCHVLPIGQYYLSMYFLFPECFPWIISNSLLKNIYTLSNSKCSLIFLLSLVDLFRNCGLGYILPRYGPMVLGRRVRIDLTTTHLKPACVQTKTPSLKPWSHAYGRENYYKRVMAGSYNMTITIIIKIYAYCQSEHRKY